MANILLKSNDEVLIHGSVSDLTPLGVECDVDFAGLESLRNEYGKFKTLDIEVQLKSHGRNNTVCGTGNVYSVRRISQSRCMINIRFTSLEQNGFNLISAQNKTDGVVNLTEVRSARQSRSA